ncbi:MAG: type II toxin-antitoxin system HicB family antitoxin [Verrucomicrobiia bacterium]
MSFPLTAGIEAALELARYDQPEDGSYAGEIRRHKGVAAFGLSLRKCESELRSTLADWILVGLALGQQTAGAGRH